VGVDDPGAYRVFAASFAAEGHVAVLLDRVASGSAERDRPPQPATPAATAVPAAARNRRLFIGSHARVGVVG
jgi:hypothetical protein